MICTYRYINQFHNLFSIFQVVVSSKGFIETSEDGILKSIEPLKPTEFLKVSDSDDDYDPRKGQKRKSIRENEGRVQKL